MKPFLFCLSTFLHLSCALAFGHNPCLNFSTLNVSDTPIRYYQRFQVIRFPGLKRNPAWTLSAVVFNFSCQSEDYDVSTGPSNDSVCNQYAKATNGWSRLFMSYDSWSPKHISVQPFKEVFIGLHMKTEESSCDVSFFVQKISMFYAWLLVFSLFTFVKASSLSKSAWMHLSTGTVIGVVGSLLLLAYVISRFIPRKSVSALFFLGGWSMTAYVAKFLYQNFIELSETYKLCLVGYCVVVGAMSLAFCYHRGPIENERTHNIIAAVIRVLAAIGVYNSVQLVEVSCALIVIMLTYKYFPVPTLSFYWLTFKWGRCYPPKKVYLSMEAYQLQGEIETQKALDELRAFCQSPQTNPWKIVKRLSRPDRVASFVDGEDHLSQLEMSLYDEEMSRLSLMDSSENENQDEGEDSQLTRPVEADQSFGAAEMTSSSASGGAREISPEIGSPPRRERGNNLSRKSDRDEDLETDESEDSGNTEN